MLLSDILSQNSTVPLAAIGSHPGLAVEVQTCLTRIGILDPPSDGKFGPVSRWALASLNGTTVVENLDPHLADLLLNASTLPLTPENGLATQLLDAMQSRNFWIARVPGCVNIVYVEGMSPNGTRNDNAPNKFNDTRLALQVLDGGAVKVADAWEATTEPGSEFTNNPQNPQGAARISFGQFKAWCVGNHKNNPDHEALVQTQILPVYRDRNKDFRREGDSIDSGLFGINQHHGWDYMKEDIRNASAGCLVGRLKTGHRNFMKIVKSDPRYLASRGYTFMTTVMPASALDIGPVT